MNKSIFSICFLFLFSLTAVVSGQKSTDKYSTVKDTLSLIAKINGATTSIQSTESDFTQEKYLSIMTDKVISKGKLYYKAPNLVRWEYTQPYAYIIVFNNGKIFIKDDKKVKKFDASSNKNFSELNDNLTMIIQGKLFSQRKDFNYKYQESDKYYLVTLFPQAKKLKDLFGSILVYFNKNDYSVYAIKLMEAQKDYTLIRFSNRKNNVQLSNEKFSIN